MTVLLISCILCPIALLIGYQLGKQQGPRRFPVVCFKDGTRVASLYYFEWLAITPPANWPPLDEVVAAARMVGCGFSALEVERIVTAVRPMALRALGRGERALGRSYLPS